MVVILYLGCSGEDLTPAWSSGCALLWNGRSVAMVLRWRDGERDGSIVMRGYSRCEGLLRRARKAVDVKGCCAGYGRR
eukprot:305551-Rhodomonas_salina.1